MFYIIVFWMPFYDLCVVSAMEKKLRENVNDVYEMSVTWLVYTDTIMCECALKFPLKPLSFCV